MIFWFTLIVFVVSAIGFILFISLGYHPRFSYQVHQVRFTIALVLGVSAFILGLQILTYESWWWSVSGGFLLVTGLNIVLSSLLSASEYFRNSPGLSSYDIEYSSVIGNIGFKFLAEYFDKTADYISNLDHENLSVLRKNIADSIYESSYLCKVVSDLDYGRFGTIAVEPGLLLHSYTNSLVESIQRYKIYYSDESLTNENIRRLSESIINFNVELVMWIGIMEWIDEQNRKSWGYTSHIIRKRRDPESRITNQPAALD